MSMRPGTTYRPETSTTLAALAAGISAATAAILPPAISHVQDRAGLALAVDDAAPLEQ
jgi:hypothetical protein